MKAVHGTEKFTQKFIDALDPPDERVEITDTDISQLTLRVYPSGQKTYFVRYRKPKTYKQTRYKLGEADSMTVKQARDAARLKLSEVSKGIDPIEAKRARKADALTLGEYIDGDYAKTVLTHFKSGDAIKDRLKRCFDEFWKRKLNDPTLHNAVLHWQAKRIKGGTNPATVNRDLGALKAVFARALDRGLIKEHPLAKLKPLKLDTSPKVRYLSPDEETNLMKALDKREKTLQDARISANEWRKDRRHPEYTDLRSCAFSDHLKPMVILSLETGMRRGELFNLEWSDIDFDQNPAHITVRGEIAKSGSTRHIPLSSKALATVQGWKAQTDSEGLVFKSKNGDRFDNVNSSWEGVLAEAKITGFRWHDMRHHFASTLVMRGADLNTVRELLGHSDIKMTLRYAHLAPHAKAKAIALLNAGAVGNIVSFPFTAREA